MTETRHMTLADYVRELTETHPHAEIYQTKSITGPGFVDARHITRAPSLLAQLWANDTPSAAVEEGPRPGFASKPAARLDALDAAVRIDLEASRWVRDLGEDDWHTDTAATIRQLHGLVASTQHCGRHRPLLDGKPRKVVCCTAHAIEHDVRRWWIRARVVTGWDSAAWKPDNTCPQCSERGTLRVRLADHIATCTNDACRVVWDEATIGLLAEHIRAESEAERQPRTGAGPCWCPYPKPIVPDLSRLCPGCGSARCRHALGARLLDTIRAQTG